MLESSSNFNTSASFNKAAALARSIFANSVANEEAPSKEKIQTSSAATQGSLPYRDSIYQSAIARVASDSKSRSNAISKIAEPEYIKTHGGIEEYKLPNGMKILLMPDKNAPVTSLRMCYKVGSKDDPKDCKGMAHFLEHMVFKEMDGFPLGTLDDLLSLYGFSFNASTSVDRTVYQMDCPPEHLDLALRLESARMGTAKFSKTEMDKERSVVKSELEMYKNSPFSVLNELLDAAAHKSNPYKDPVIGYKKHLDRMTPSRMKAHYNKYYKNPSNVTLILGGNFDKTEALARINELFGVYKKKPAIKRLIKKDPPQRQAKKVLAKHKQQVRLLAMAYHVPHINHEDSYALDILESMLSMGLNSRLHKRLVEDEDVAFGAGAWSGAGSNDGLLKIFVSAKKHYDLQALEAIVEEEIQKIIDEGISDEEFERIKNIYKSHKIFSKDGITGQVASLTETEANQPWTEYVDVLDKLDKVTKEQVIEVTKKYLQEKNKTTVYLVPEKKSGDTQAVFLQDSSIHHDSHVKATDVSQLDAKRKAELDAIYKPEKAMNLDFPMPLDLQRKDIGQGAEIMLKEDHSLPVIHIFAGSHGGSLRESKDQPYLSAFTTGLIMKGGAGSKDKYQLETALDNLGASISFSGGGETQGLMLSVLSKNLTPTLKILSEYIKEPQFDPQELEKMKKDVIDSLKIDHEPPSVTASRKFSQIVYPEDHKYYTEDREKVIKKIKAITLDDVKAFYKQNFKMDDMKISVVGDVTMDQLVSSDQNSLSQLLKAWNQGSEQAKIQEIPLVDKKEAVTEHITDNTKAQSAVIIGHPTELTSRHKDYYLLLLANYILSQKGVGSSRLGKVVREQNGLVYGINSMFQASNLGAGPFTINFGTNPKNVDRAIALVQDVIKDFVENGITQEELDGAKSHFIQSHPMAFSTRWFSSLIFESLALQGKDEDFIKNYGYMINDIKLEDVNRAIKEHIQPGKMHTITCGPDPKAAQQLAQKQDQAKQKRATAMAATALNSEDSLGAHIANLSTALGIKPEDIPLVPAKEY